MTMRKQELVNTLSEKTNFTKKDVRIFLAALEEITVETLQADREITLMNGLTVSRVFKESRPTRNPSTGEAIMSKAKYHPKCKFGKFMKESVNPVEVAF